MIIYILNIILPCLICAHGLKKGSVKYNILGEKYIEPANYAYIAAVAILIFTYAARGYTGTDTHTYIFAYRSIGNYSLQDTLARERDWLFSVVIYLNYIIFGKNGIIYNNIILGMLTFLPTIYVYKKYSGNLVIAIFLYITTTVYYFGFNGQRQGIAIAITMLGYPYLLKKNYKLWLLICIIASFFHNTAYLIMPLGFLLTKKTTSKSFIIISVAGLVSAIVLWSIWNQLFEFLGMIGQDKLVNDYSDMNAQTSSGANPLRVVIAGIPVALGIFYYKRMSNRKFVLDLNYCIWQLIFIVASTRNIFLYRCSSFFAPVQIFLLIDIAELFDKKSKILYWTALVVLYSVYMWVSLHSEGGMLPYNLFFKYRIY